MHTGQHKGHWSGLIIDSGAAIPLAAPESSVIALRTCLVDPGAVLSTSVIGSTVGGNAAVGGPRGTHHHSQLPDRF